MSRNREGPLISNAKGSGCRQDMRPACRIPPSNDGVTCANPGTPCFLRLRLSFWETCIVHSTNPKTQGRNCWSCCRYENLLCIGRRISNEPANIFFHSIHLLTIFSFIDSYKLYLRTPLARYLSNLNMRNRNGTPKRRLKKQKRKRKPLPLKTICSAVLTCRNTASADQRRPCRDGPGNGIIHGHHLHGVPEQHNRATQRIHRPHAETGDKHGLEHLPRKRF